MMRVARIIYILAMPEPEQVWELSQPWATLIAGTAVLVSALIAGLVSVVHFARSHRLERASALRERYSVAAGQLAHESAAVRLAGTYSLVALADDWRAIRNTNEQQVCIDLLRAYLRAPMKFDLASTPKENESEGGSDETSGIRESSANSIESVVAQIRAGVLEVMDGLNPPANSEHRGEQEVRSAIVSVIAKRRLISELKRQSWKSRSTYLSNADLRGCRISGINLSGSNLAFSLFDRAILVGADMSSSHLMGAQLRGVSATHANFQGSYLLGTTFDDAQLVGVDFRKTELIGASFNGASLERANFSAMKAKGDDSSVLLQGVDFRGAQLQEADMTGARFHTVAVKGTVWSTVILADVIFESMDMSGADLSEARISNAVFKHVLYDEATRWPAGFDPKAAGAIEIESQPTGS